MYLNLDVDELVSIADETEESILDIIRELENVKEYKEVKSSLETVIDELRQTSEEFREQYNKQCDEEEYYLNREYERGQL